MEGEAGIGDSAHSSARFFLVISCPRPLESDLQAVGMWEGSLPGYFWLSLGETLEAEGWFVDGVRYESQSFLPVVSNEVSIHEQAEGRVF